MSSAEIVGGSVRFKVDELFSRPYLVALVLQCCVCLSSVCNVCIVAKWCVLEQKLLLTAYRKSHEKSIGTTMNDLDLYLEVVSRSCQPLRYIRRWISRKPSEIEAWFQRTTNRKWPTGNQMVTWPMTSREHERCCEAVRSALLTTAWLLVKTQCNSVGIVINQQAYKFTEHGPLQRLECIGWRGL